MVENKLFSAEVLIPVFVVMFGCVIGVVIGLYFIKYLLKNDQNEIFNREANRLLIEQARGLKKWVVKFKLFGKWMISESNRAVAIIFTAIILPIFCSIVANYLTPYVTNYLHHFSGSNGSPVTPLFILPEVPSSSPLFDDQGDGTIVDIKNQLMWLEFSSGQMSWKAAIRYPDKVNKEDFKGYSDWRLPGRYELTALADKIGTGTGLFKGVCPTYWSNDKKGLITAWLVRFEEGESMELFDEQIVSEDQDASHCIRLVRTMQNQQGNIAKLPQGRKE